MDIALLTSTAIIGSNNMNKDKVSKQLLKQYSNAIILSNNPLYNYSVREYILSYTNKINSPKFKKYNIDKLFDYSFNTLSIGEKQLVQIITILLSSKDIIILNDALSMITNKEIILKKINTYKNKTIINITSNKDDIVYFKKTMLIDNKVILYDDTIKLMDDETSFKLISQDLPFMASLSLKLKYYDLINKPILNMDRMVDKIWK